MVIADLGSFAEAARQLNLAPPTISLHVAELEARISAPLLSRTRGQVRPRPLAKRCWRVPGACWPTPTWRWTKYADK